MATAGASLRTGCSHMTEPPFCVCPFLALATRPDYIRRSFTVYVANAVGTENVHDILTGSRSDGTAFDSGEDLTCGNWTSSGSGRAQVGHHDRMGQGPGADSWSSAHASRGCSQQDLQGTGGAGLFYCFAID